MSSRWVDEFRYNRYRPQILDTLPNFQGEQKNHEFRFASEKGPWVRLLTNGIGWHRREAIGSSSAKVWLLRFQRMFMGKSHHRS